MRDLTGPHGPHVAVLRSRTSYSGTARDITVHCFIKGINKIFGEFPRSAPQAFSKNLPMRVKVDQRRSFFALVLALIVP